MSEKSGTENFVSTFQTLTLERTVLLTAKGGSIIFAGKLFVFASGFISAFILTRFLGAEQYGLYKLALTVVTIASSLTYLGLDLGLVRYISLFASRHNDDSLWESIQVGVGIPAFLSILAGAGLFALAHPLAINIFHEANLAPLLRLVSLVLPFITLNTMFNSITRGFNQMHYMVIADRFFNSTVKLILLVLFALIGLNATKAVTAISLAEVSVTVLFVYLVNRIFPLRRPLRAVMRLTKEIFRFSMPVYLSNTIEMFSNNIQTVLLGSFSSLLNVGIFSLASQINVVGSLFHSSISSASMPIISALYDQNKQEQLKRFYQATSKWTFTLNLPLFLIVMLFPKTLLSIFGSSFANGATALTILAWANLVNTGTGICGSMLDMTGNTRLKLVNSITTVASTLILNFLLIPSLGLIGVAIATLASVTVINSLRLIEVQFLLHMLPFNLSSAKPVFAGLLALIASLLLARIFPPETHFIATLTNWTILILVYAGAILLFKLSPEDRLLLENLQRRLKIGFAKT